MNKFPGGITVTELKALLEDWPEFDGTEQHTKVYIAGPHGSHFAASEVSVEGQVFGYADMVIG